MPFEATTKTRVAVLDDDEAILSSVERTLGEGGYECRTFSSGRQLIRALQREGFDLLVLDWNVPDFSGMNVLEWLRNHIGSGPAVLLLTSRIADEDEVEGLNSGADDYITKPFQPDVLLARIRALLRRAPVHTGRANEVYGPYAFDLAARQVRTAGEDIHLTHKEFNLSLLMFRNLNRTLARSYMLETIWGIDPDLTTRTLDIHVSKVRTKLKLRSENGFRLATVYGYGYRLEEVLP